MEKKILDSLSDITNLSDHDASFSQRLSSQSSFDECENYKSNYLNNVLVVKRDCIGPQASTIMERLKKLIVFKEKEAKLSLFARIVQFFDTNPQPDFTFQQITELGNELAEFSEQPPQSKGSKIQFVISKKNLNNNETYTGFLINKKREGYGKVVHVNKTVKYEGQFKNNGYEGKCIKIYYDKEKLAYEGGHCKGHKKGFGRLYWSNGKVCYEGEWASDNPVGKQIFIYDRDGKVAYKGDSLGVSIIKYFQIRVKVNS